MEEKYERKILSDELCLYFPSLIQEEKIDEAFCLLEKVKPQIIKLAEDEEDCLLQNLNKGYHIVAINYFFRRDFEKCRTILVDTASYCYTYAEKGSKIYKANYIVTMRYISLSFEAQEIWGEAHKINKELLEYCKLKDSMHLYVKSYDSILDGIVGLSITPDDIQKFLELLDIDSVFDCICNDEINDVLELNLTQEIDIIYERISAQSSYSYVLAKYTKLHWKAYKALIKVYCFISDIIEVFTEWGFNVRYAELCNQRAKVKPIMQYLGDVILDTTPILWGMENVVRHQKCSKGFLLQQCGLFGRIRQNCIKQMILWKVILVGKDGTYEVLVKDVKELRSMLGIKGIEKKDGEKIPPFPEYYEVPFPVID